MSFISKITRVGGLQKLDSGDNKRIINVIAGSKESSKHVRVGDKSNLKLLDLTLEWNAFMNSIKKASNFSIPEVVRQKYIDNIIRIFDLPKTIMNIHQLLKLLKDMSVLDDATLTTWLSKKFNIYESIALGAQALFWSWKTHLESLIQDYNKARNRYIKANKVRGKGNDLNKLSAEWLEIDKEYKINTSSLILLYVNPPKDPNILPWVSSKSKVHWKKMSRFAFDISKGTSETKSTINKLKKSLEKWTYFGFCKYKPLDRLKKLLAFPIEELINGIQVLNPQYKVGTYCKIMAQLDKIKHVKRPKLALVQKVKKEKKDKSSHHQDHYHGDLTIVEINKTVKYILQRYIKLKPNLVKMENYYIDTADILNNIAKKLNILT